MLVVGTFGRNNILSCLYDVLSYPIELICFCAFVSCVLASKRISLLIAVVNKILSIITIIITWRKGGLKNPLLQNTSLAMDTICGGDKPNIQS